MNLFRKCTLSRHAGKLTVLLLVSGLAGCGESPPRQIYRVGEELFGAGGGIILVVIFLIAIAKGK